MGGYWEETGEAGKGVSPPKRTKRRTMKCERVEQSLTKKKKVHGNKSSFSCYIHKLILLMRNHINTEGRGEDGCTAVVFLSTREPVWCVEHNNQLSSSPSPSSPSHPSPLSTDCNSSLLNKKKKAARLSAEVSDSSFFGRPGPRGKH